jgi:pyruvate dehydrogenase E2 component (dihydrolipoamide acetyltransferase)
MRIEVQLPKWGLTMSEATIVRWLRTEGEHVEEGDPLVEVETEKANAEVPAPSAGVIAHVVANIGAVIPVGGVLALLEVSDAGTTAARPAASVPPLMDDGPAGGSPLVPADRVERSEEQVGRASPFARRVARDLGIEIGGLRGTGPKGLVTETDVRAAAAKQKAEGPGGAIHPARTERLSPIRKGIAAAMTRSLSEAAQLTLTRDVGMSGALAVRREAAGAATLTDVMLATVARVLARHPRLNAHLVGDELRFYDTVNIGLAVALDHGLVSPVIRNVSSLSLAEIANLRRDLVERARGGRLRQAELEGGTFTVTNLGMYGIDTFTPILKLPEVAILGIGAVRGRPAVSGGDLVVRDMCSLGLTFDHRALDGAPAAAFLADLAGLFQDTDRLKEELR